MIFIRKHKNTNIDEAWFDSFVNDNSNPIKIELQKTLQKLVGKEITVSVDNNLDYKFFNYIAGQLMESKIRTFLNLEKTANNNLDGIYKNDYFIEVKAFFVNKQSSARKMFTSGEKEFIKSHEDMTYGILCKYQHTQSSTQGKYKILGIYVLTGTELLKHIM